MKKYSTTLIEEIDKISEVVIRRKNDDNLESFYEFCYCLVCKARREFDDCKNEDLLREYLKEDVEKMHGFIYNVLFGG
jgi:hypothetical protein